MSSNVERTARRDPISSSVPISTPLERNPEPATTAETQQRSTNNNALREERDKLREKLSATESTLLDTRTLLKKLKRRLDAANYQLPHGAEGHAQSKDEASACEHSANLFRNSKEAIILHDYLKDGAFNDGLLFSRLRHENRMYIEDSRSRTDSLEMRCKLCQIGLTHVNSLERLRHELALSRATIDHATFDFKLEDQHRENLNIIRLETIHECFRAEDVEEAVTRGVSLEHDERARYQRARDESLRQRNAQFQALHNKQIECYHWPSSRDGKYQSYREFLEAKTAEVQFHPYRTNRERLHRQYRRQARRHRNVSVTLAATGSRDANNGSQVSMQGYHTHRDQQQTRAIDNTNGRLEGPERYGRHQEAQLQPPISAPPTQVSPPRDTEFERNYNADEYDSDGSDFTMNTTAGVRGSFRPIVPLNSTYSNDSARKSTVGMRSGEGNNPSQSSNQIEYNNHQNERANPAGPANITDGLNWTLPSHPSLSHHIFSQPTSLNTTSASGSTPILHPSALGNLGVPGSSAQPSLYPLQRPSSPANPSAAISPHSPRAAFEPAIHSKITINMDPSPAASPPPQFAIAYDFSQTHDPTTSVPQQPAPAPRIRAGQYPLPDWNTADSRTWMYETLVHICGISEFDAYVMVMRWMGGGMNLRLMSLADWQACTTMAAGWYFYHRIN
ncbi:hypothetical protein BOTCAL_0271g00050 [Botryotinia calthae]|uniref:Uncharacterized protein n=1 Tax=Botryotinia calthae TaxID=38488 RepID=A0A4Y8CWK0_9HELO|nr:hypothetical protein BOTCAL_0271g00050 [Botryotinia calthae]